MKEADVDELRQLVKLGISFTKINSENGQNHLHKLAYDNKVNNRIFEYLVELGNDIHALDADGYNMIDIYGEGLEKIDLQGDIEDGVDNSV